MHLHRTAPDARQKYAAGSVLATVSVLFIAAVILVSLPYVMMGTANAIPPGYWYIQANVNAGDISHSFGVMDVANSSGIIDGFVHLNEPATSATDPSVPSPTQQWEQVFPATGSTDVIMLKNKATGTCVGDAVGNSATATMRPCVGNSFVLWEQIIQSQGWVFRQITQLPWPFPDINVCLGKGDDPTIAETLACNLDDGTPYPQYVVWTATTQPLGTTSIGLTPPLPSVPPVKPTSCKLAGTIAACGLVGFKCNPLSAGDKIVVSSGKIGVNVTAVEPKLGLITGTYLNQGKAAVAVCAINSGQAFCGDAIDVTFGPTLCSGPPPHRVCPTGQIPCEGGCSAFSNPECHLQ